MCNCSSIPANICNQCAQGNACGCPPDYTVLSQPVACGCCPAGYTYVPGATPNNPPTCVDGTGKTTAPIPCPSCESTLSSDCVILPAISCVGFPGGTLTYFATFLCTSTRFIESILTTIGGNTALGSGFCQLVQNCPALGSGTTPVLGPIVVTFP